MKIMVATAGAMMGPAPSSLDNCIPAKAIFRTKNPMYAIAIFQPQLFLLYNEYRNAIGPAKSSKTTMIIAIVP